jgi:hypothetical protein
MAKNDRPTNLRMGFGYKQAKDSGIPFLPQRPLYEVNERIRQNSLCQKIEEICKNDEINKARVKKLIDEGRSIDEVFAILQERD